MARPPLPRHLRARHDLPGREGRPRKLGREGKEGEREAHLEREWRQLKLAEAQQDNFRGLCCGGGVSCEVRRELARRVDAVGLVRRQGFGIVGGEER